MPTPSRVKPASLAACSVSRVRSRFSSIGGSHCSGNASASRPLAASPARSRSDTSASAATSDCTGAIQPSPTRAARATAGSESPPKSSGGPPGVTGLGSMLISRIVVHSPSKLIGSVVQQARITSIASSIRAPRRRNGTPSDSYSPSCQPIPSPSLRRPPESTSISAACLATSTGSRCVSTSTFGCSATRLVWAASQASVVITSCCCTSSR